MNKHKSSKSLTKEILGHLVICGTSIVIGSLFLPYGEGLGRSLRKAGRVLERCHHDFSSSPRNTVSTALSRLKRRGLITVSGPKKKAVWLITEKGKSHFQKAENFVLPKEDGKMRLVAFDIPEKERGKRAWLRARLLSCSYKPFQKSVWLGTRPLPELFLKELCDRNLMPYVHIIGLEESLRLD